MKNRMVEVFNEIDIFREGLNWQQQRIKKNLQNISQKIYVRVWTW